MPFYHKQGQIPKKRHTQFRKKNGELYAEELVSTEGFSNIYSLIYHCHPPTMVKSIKKSGSMKPNFVVTENLKHRSFTTFSFKAHDDYLKSRKILMGNKDLYVVTAAPKKSMEDYFFKNADADEVLFIHEGNGVLKTIYGQIPFEYGDYLVIPRGTIYQLEFADKNNRIFITESFSPIHPPKRYLNNFGQLLSLLGSE